MEFHARKVWDQGQNFSKIVRITQTCLPVSDGTDEPIMH